MTEIAGQRQTALVTGASAGIGLELARLFAADGHDLVVVARTADRLNALKDELERAHGIRVHVLVSDLSDPDAPRALHGAVTGLGLRVDALVNNAGFGGYGLFHETDLDSELRMIQVNVAALVSLTKLFVRDMIAHGGGGVMNISSTAAFQAGPRQSIYYATKAFVLSFSEALSVELDGTGVRVMAYCPGPTQTEFHARAGTETSFKQLHMMSAAEAARAGYEGFRKGKSFLIPGLQNRVLAFGTRFFPRSFNARVAGKLQSID